MSVEARRPLLLVGDYKAQPAEGMEVITSVVLRCIRSSERCFCVSPAKPIELIRYVLMRRPRALIFTHGPGSGVFFLSTLISVLPYVKKIIWVASRPDIKSFNYIRRSLAHKLVVFVSHSQKHLVDNLHEKNIEIRPTTIGIDFEKYLNPKLSVREEIFSELRRSGFDTTKPTVLHVGHLRKNRGLDELVKAKRLLGDAINVLVIASPSLDRDGDVEQTLLTAGAVIYDQYMETLVPIYKLADIYCFPVDPVSRGAIDLPLSILEAVMSGLHVITTPFGLIPDLFADYPGVTICDKSRMPEKIEKEIMDIKNMTSPAPLDRDFDLATLAEQIITEVKLV